MPSSSASRCGRDPRGRSPTFGSAPHGFRAPLVAQDGQRFRVLYPGRRSARAGPDFRDAILRGDEGRRVVGDVELHLRAPDWYSHSHHADPNYNGVVLHVVLRPKGASDTRSQAGGSVPVVGLEAQAEALEGVSAAPPPLPQVSEANTPEELARLLAEAGDRRFLLRSGAFSLELRGGDPDQVLYAALMESLGYSANRKPFRTLAARVPYAALSRLRSEPASTRLLALEAALAGASGLLPRLAPGEHRELVERARALMRRGRAMSLSDWTHFRVRPTNHPIRRILGAARIFDRFLDAGLARGVQADADNRRHSASDRAAGRAPIRGSAARTRYGRQRGPAVPARLRGRREIARTPGGLPGVVRRVSQAERERDHARRRCACCRTGAGVPSAARAGSRG